MTMENKVCNCEEYVIKAQETIDKLTAIVKDNDKRIDELEVKFDHLLEQHKGLWDIVKKLMQMDSDNVSVCNKVIHTKNGGFYCGRKAVSNCDGSLRCSECKYDLKEQKDV